jgi:hypothetical protein
MGRIQRNGLKIDESEVNDTVNKYKVHQYFEIGVYLDIIFLQYFTIYKVHIILHQSHEVFISLYQTKTTPKSHIST